MSQSQHVPENWKILLDKNEIEKGVEYCAEKLNERFGNSKEKFVVIGILKGAVYFQVDLSRRLTFDHSLSFISASSYQNDQVQETIIVKYLNPKDLEGRKVILVDELYDNGHTINQVKKEIIKVTKLKEDDIFTCTLFKKNKQLNDKGLDLFAFLVPNVWLVGYGLDDKQEKRNLQALYAIPADNDVNTDTLFGNQEIYNQVKQEIMYKLYRISLKLNC